MLLKFFTNVICDSFYYTLNVYSIKFLSDILYILLMNEKC